MVEIIEKIYILHHFENFIIYYMIVGITFNLDVSLNNHKEQLNIDELEYSTQLFFPRFMLSFIFNGKGGKYY